MMSVREKNSLRCALHTTIIVGFGELSTFTFCVSAG